MHVDALRIFDQLPFNGLLVRKLHDADGYLVHLGKVGGTEAPRSRDDLIAFAVGPNGNRLDESLATKTFGKLGQLRFIKGAAWIGGGLVNAGQGESLKSCGLLFGRHGRCSSFWFWSSAFQPNAERHLAKAGGSNCKLRGIPTLVTEQGEVERASERGGLHKRSAEDWGSGLRARGGWPPSRS